MADKKPEKIGYRPATAMDSVNIVRLLKSQYDDSAARYLATFDEAQLLQYVTTTLGNFDPGKNGAAFCLVAEKDGRLLGSVAMAQIRIPWNQQFIVMAECWFSVIPQYLAKGVAAKLRDHTFGFLDKAGRSAFFGTNMYTSPAIDAIVAEGAGVHASRTSYIRIPNAVTKAA